MRNSKTYMGLVAAIVLFLVFVSANVYIQYGTMETVQVEVTEKYRNCEQGSNGRTDCYWMVMTDSEVFKNTDSLWHFKWDSSDVQSNLREGESYSVDVVGFRVPFLSMYRNILSVE